MLETSGENRISSDIPILENDNVESNVKNTEEGIKSPPKRCKERTCTYFRKSHHYSEQNINVLNLVQNCEIDTCFPKRRMLYNFGTRQMLQNEQFVEHAIELNTNKVFCSTWLSDQVVLMGTKCNKLLVYNIISGKLFKIPCLRSSPDSLSCDPHCGIHAAAMNPSKTRLATGGRSSNDVAVYSLPDFVPICVGEGAHSDWIFDIKWLDDEFFVSGARDGKIALWHVGDNCSVSNYNNFSYYHMKPVILKTCGIADKIRALHFNPPHELIAVSLNSYIHSWDMRIFERIFSQKLPTRENVCLTYNDQRKVYAVGSLLNVVILEGSKFSTVKTITNQNHAVSVRSVSFRGDLLTMGTGLGRIFFYDVSGGNFLLNGKNPIFLSAKSGTVSIDVDNEVNHAYSQYPAIYTHCYDTSGTRLFAAGGPLPIGFHGYYAALWQ